MRTWRAFVAVAAVLAAPTLAVPARAVAVPAAAAVVFRPLDFGFEAPRVPSGTTSTPVSSTTWIYTGNAGIAAPGSTLLPARLAAPQGDQVGYVGRDGRLGRYIGVKTGDVLVFSVHLRRGADLVDQSIVVTLDGVPQDAAIVPTDARWTTVRVPLSVTGERAMLLELRSGRDVDGSVLVDNVVIARQAWTVSRPPFVAPSATVYDVPAAGLPAERRSIMSSVTDDLPDGVGGLLDLGDSERDIQAQVLAIAEWRGRVYVGGKFAEVRHRDGRPASAQPYLAAFDQTTGVWIDTFRPRLDGSVWDLEVTADGRLIVAGQFTAVDGQPGTTALAALDPLTGDLVEGWRADVDWPGGEHRAIVRDVDIADGWIYLGGEFTRIVGGRSSVRSTVSNLARVTVSDGRPSIAAFVPQVSGEVLDVEATPRRIYAVGYIRAVNNRSRSTLAVLDPADGSLITGLGTVVQSSTNKLNHYMQSVLLVGGQLWVSGSQHATQVYRANDLALLRSWVSEPYGDGQALVASNGIVYAGNHANRRTFLYTDVASWPPIEQGTRADPIAWIGAWDAARQAYVSGWVPDIGSRTGDGVWELFADSRRCLWAGGDINRGAKVEGVTRWAQGFARFCPVDDNLPTPPTSPARTVTLVGQRLTWSPATDAEGPVTYEVLRNGRVIATGRAATAFVDRGGSLLDRYVVRAVDAAGNRSASTARF